jgi:hypothetical protein
MWKLIPLLAIPFAGAIATFPSNSHDICFEAESGLPIPCQDLDDSNISGGEEWDCDIRAWTRAPDLIPGHSIPAETRLSMNGSQCSDIKGWEVGLRMKEKGYYQDHVCSSTATDPFSVKSISDFEGETTSNSQRNQRGNHTIILLLNSRCRI